MTLIKHIPNFEILHKEIQEHLIKNLENEELLAFIETFDFSEEHIAEYYNQAFEHLIPPEVKETAEKLIEKNDAESMKKEILIFIAQTYVSSDNK
jgi:ribonucleotide reductase beta subunit family protein with ferritin-like domain